MSAKPKVELIVISIVAKDGFNVNVKYFANGKRYDVGIKRDLIGNQQWAFDWHYKL